jgi:hypothetical protein
MQPSLEELEESFSILLRQVVSNAKAHSEQQTLLGDYLSAHPELFSVRFRTHYLKEDSEILIRELTRTCSVTEENIDLLQDIVKGLNSPELANLFEDHNMLIMRRKTPGYTALDPASNKIFIFSSCYFQKYSHCN